MKQNQFKRFLIPFILLVLFIYVYIGNIGKMTEVINTDGQKNVGEITSGTEVSQSFISPMNNLSGFSIKLATYARVNEGRVTLGIRELGDSRTIYSTTIKAESLPDNAYYDVRFPPIKFSKDKKYLIFVSSTDSSAGHAITAYMSSKDTYSDGDYMKNGEQQQGDLAFKVVCNHTLF
ncbi:hypothetical protein ACE3MZ_20380 [Paenibacillus sp. WLX1005]|uniref:hypothetical protein n=1 Tax=Paenibacillus sp. WLX1005 TaxID=3243766 RepID=UPI0039841131